MYISYTDSPLKGVFLLTKFSNCSASESMIIRKCLQVSNDNWMIVKVSE